MQPKAPVLINKRLAPDRKVKWLHSEIGRAFQMNVGASAATKPYLWFLHADSRFSRSTLSALEHSLGSEPRALHYFNLEFQDDGPKVMPVNAFGVWWRSHFLGLPFGDQGFCLSKEDFLKLGGYSESAPYGEDHLLVWKAKQIGLPLRCTSSTLSTSARKYQAKGWAKTTLRHGVLTWKQALPEFMRWTKLRAQKKNRD